MTSENKTHFCYLEKKNYVLPKLKCDIAYISVPYEFEHFFAKVFDHLPKTSRLLSAIYYRQIACRVNKY